MKKLLIVLLAASFLTACNNETQKSDNEKTETTSEAAEASDTTSLVDKAQEGMNEVIDTLQSKGGKLADTLKKKVVEPVKTEVKKAAEKVKAAGMQAGFHNHATEFGMLDGKLIYDELMKRLDPKLVKMQFQTEVINLGYKAADYFKKYPNRFISSHLSDWTSDKKQAPIGKGVIDWKDFFAAAKTGGVKYFFVEMDPETFGPSIAYRKQL